MTGTQGQGRQVGETCDVVLIGGGIMSATLGMLLRRMAPDWDMRMYERADEVALESSNEWNNAGTGHAALCELNYTPQTANGTIDLTKAVRTNIQFHETRQFWSHLVETGVMRDPDTFIRSVPHNSWVMGEDDVAFLRARYELLRAHPLFTTMEYSESADRIAEWVPIMMDGRHDVGPIAMTRSTAGTDVNFGEATRQLVKAVTADGASVHVRHEVVGLEKLIDGRWRVSVRNRDTGGLKQVDTRFVFIGAGGHAIHLLQKSGIPESCGYGGFPVSGQFLRCTDRELLNRHDAKVYGQPQVNAPPMSMPHLDSREVNGEHVLLFGPFAGFSPRFLKRGSITDLPRSIVPGNLRTYLDVSRDEVPLTTYLVKQVVQKHIRRIAVLQNFVPLAEAGDWELHNAGMRVQTMKRNARGRGSIEFGTEVVTSGDGTLAGLLGASPGASTAVSIMLQVVERCFPAEWSQFRDQVKAMIPSHGEHLAENQSLLDDVTSTTSRVLRLAG